MQKSKTTLSIKRIGVSLASVILGTIVAVSLFVSDSTYANWKSSVNQEINSHIQTGNWSSEAAPTFTKTTIPNVAKGISYSQEITTTGNDVTFSVSSGALPPGFVLNTTTGVISGTSNGSGDYNFTLTATNPGGSVAQVYTIRILESTQIIPNGGFESGMANWAWRFPGGDIASGSIPSNTGSYAGARYARITEGMLVSDRVNVTPGETLTLKFAHRNVGVLSYSLPYVGIIYYDDLGNIEQSSVLYKMDPASVWTPLSYTIVVPAGYKYAELYFSGDYEGGATTVYDGVSLTGLR